MEKNPGARIWMATTKAKHVYSDVRFGEDDYITGTFPWQHMFFRYFPYSPESPADAALYAFLLLPNLSYKQFTPCPFHYSDVRFGEDDYIMFGKESAGIPEEVLVEYEETCIRIQRYQFVHHLIANCLPPRLHYNIRIFRTVNIIHPTGCSGKTERNSEKE